MRPSTGGKDGFASIVVVVGTAVLLLVFGGAVAVSDLVATGSGRVRPPTSPRSRRRGPPPTDPAAACERAASIAAANRARLQSCRIGAGDRRAGSFDADVVVAADVVGPMRAIAAWLGLEVPVVRARALAGPPRCSPVTRRSPRAT